jgi:apolipoprotein N-acyltransferase
VNANTESISSRMPVPAFVVRLLAGISLSALGAVLLTLSMPPYGLWPLAVIGLVPTILAQYRIMPRQLSSLAPAITIGGLVGLYIMKAFLQLANAPWSMKLLPVIFGLIVFLADLGSRAFHTRTGYRWLVLSGALGWVGVEMIRSLIPVIGTWGFIAYAYFKQPWMIQPVSIFGIFGLSLVTMLTSYALGQVALAWFDRRWTLDGDRKPVELRQARDWLVGAGLVCASWLALSASLFSSPGEHTIRVAAIQPDYESLWTAQEMATNALSPARYRETYNQLLERLLAQTRTAAEQGAELIVWPEGALNVDPQRVLTRLLRDLAVEADAYLVIPYAVADRNEVTILSPDGQFLGVYGKNHPVVFVNERSRTRGTYPTYSTDLGELGTIICYDLDFTDTARKVARNGATLIAVPSGDWPGIADKHYAHLVFRAAENGVAMIKSDRSYDSAVIDPQGRLVDTVISVAGQQATLVADVPLVEANPPQRHLGDWIGWLSLGGMAFFALFGSRLGAKGVFAPADAHARGIQAKAQCTHETEST